MGASPVIVGILVAQVNRLYLNKHVDNSGAGIKEWREKRAGRFQQKLERLQDSITFTTYCTVSLFRGILAGLPFSP